MQTYTKVIRTPIEKVMHVLNVDKKQAYEVLVEMQLDFSECTNLEFAREAKFCYDMIKLKRNPEKYKQYIKEVLGVDA